MPVTLGDGYSYDDELLFIDKDSARMHTAVLGMTQEPVDCDECLEPIGIGLWAYYVQDNDQAMHPRCMFKQPCRRATTVLYRGIR